MKSKWGNWLNTDLSLRAQDRLLRRFPDLAYFDDASRQRAAYWKAKAAVDRKPIQFIVPWAIGLGVFLLLPLMKAQGNWVLLTIPALLAICAYIQMLTQRPLLRAEIRRIILHVKQHCGQCDYSLIGNNSGRCPECGTKIPTDQRQLISALNASGRTQDIESVSRF